MQRYKTAFLMLTVTACLLLLCIVLSLGLKAQEAGRFLMVQTTVDPAASVPYDKYTDDQLLRIIERYYDDMTGDGEAKTTVGKIIAKGSARDFLMQPQGHSTYYRLFVSESGGDGGYYGIVAKIKANGKEAPKLFILKAGQATQIFDHYQHRPTALPVQKASSGRRAAR